MKLSPAFHKAVHKGLISLKRSAPTILTTLGSLGVIATAVLAVKETPKALKLIEAERKSFVNIGNGNGTTDDIEFTPMEVVAITWKCYIPAAAVALATITCIFGANVLSRRQQAAITSAYIFMSKAYREYRNKVKELYGPEADDKVTQEIAKDKYHLKPVPRAPSGDMTLYYEEHYGNYFESTEEQVVKAEYELNRQFNDKGYASLNDFYNLLDLADSEIGDFIGWTFEDGARDGYGWIDFDHETVILEDGLECRIIKFRHPPTDESGAFRYDAEARMYMYLHPRDVE